MIALKHKREKNGEKRIVLLCRKTLTSMIQECFSAVSAHPPEVGCWNSTVADPGQEVQG